MLKVANSLVQIACLKALYATAHKSTEQLSSFGDSAHLVHGIPHYGHLQPLQAQVSIVCAHCPKII